MKPHRTPLARAAALLLAAAALPLTPAIAQEAAQPAEEAPAPDATTSIPPPEATTPVQTTETVSPAPVTETEAAAEAAPARTTTRRTTTTRTATTRTRVPATVVTPAPVAVVPVPVDTLPPVATAPLPPPVAQTPPLEVLPETPPAPVTTTVETEDSRNSLLPWLLGGLLLLGALAFFALRRRRRTDVYDEQTYAPAEPVHVAPVAAPVAAAPIVTPVDTVVPAGRPELDLTMRPRRAGVSGDDARVEFELTVGNSGPVAAENVRISTWMLAAGSSEAESALIVPRDHADTPPVTIGAGKSRTMEASVALPTAEVEGDAVLPVVVADARYRLPDGREGRTSASFAVGVPDGEELAHFGIDNPSGLHEGVVAQPARRARAGLTQSKGRGGTREGAAPFVIPAHADRSGMTPGSRCPLPARRNASAAPTPLRSRYPSSPSSGRCSMKCFASVRPRPVNSRTSLMTWIFLSHQDILTSTASNGPSFTGSSRLSFLIPMAIT